VPRPLLVLFGAVFFLAACGGTGMKAESSEHAVLIHLKTSDIEFDQVAETENELIKAVQEEGLGEVEGHELAVDGSEVVYYVYGPDADALFAAVEPVIRRFPAREGSYVIRRYGDVDDPDAREVRIDL
jgi:hypothetical protein